MLEILFHSLTQPMRAVLVSLASLTLAAHASAQEPADKVPLHDTLAIESKALGERRAIHVHVPARCTAKRTTRCRVLYMPDGGIEEDFPHVVNTVDSLVSLGRIRPAIVIGIPNTQRRRDLTGPTRVHSDSTIAPRVGGSAAFRAFIRDELIPAIDARYRTTHERAIVGESLAGLFIVETFVLEPELFGRSIAFDPSLWWNAGALVDTTRARTKSLGGRRTLYVAVSKDGIGDLATKFADVFRTARPKRLAFTFVEREDLTHSTIFRAMLPSALTASYK